MAAKRPCTHEELTDITIRDAYSRGNHVLELGGNSSNIRLINAHGFGSADCILSTRFRADSRNLYGNGLFFRCIQGSRYMRGTATSMIKDPKKYIGAVARLGNFQATDAVLENIFVEKCGNAFTASGEGKVAVRNLNIGQVGRELSKVVSGFNLEIDGQAAPTL